MPGPPANLGSAFNSTPSMISKFLLLLAALTVLAGSPVAAGTKHSPSSRHSSYEGRIMCGYQGWFRAEGDSSGRGWVHYFRGGNFETPTTDCWPDVSEYLETY